MRFRKKIPILKTGSWYFQKKIQILKTWSWDFFCWNIIWSKNKNHLTMTEVTAQRMEEMTCLSSIAVVPSLSKRNLIHRHSFVVPLNIVKNCWKWFSSKFEEFKSSSDLKCWELVIYVGCNEMNSERSKIKNNTLYYRTLCTVKNHKIPEFSNSFWWWECSLRYFFPTKTIQYSVRYCTVYYSLPFTIR